MKRVQTSATDKDKRDFRLYEIDCTVKINNSEARHAWIPTLLPTRITKEILDRDFMCGFCVCHEFRTPKIGSEVFTKD